MDIWFPQKTYRTPAWHIKNETTGEPAYLYVLLKHEHDALGVETGKAHLMVWERWGEGGGYGQPSDSVPIREALKAMDEVVAEGDKNYKRVNDRDYTYYRALAEEYHKAAPLSEHPWRVAEESTRLEAPLSTSATLRFRVPAANGGLNDKVNGGLNDITKEGVNEAAKEAAPITWRTTAFRGTTGYPPVAYLSFMELAPSPEAEKEGGYRLYTWRIGPASTYHEFFETGLQRAREVMSYHDWQHQHYKCPEVTANGDSGLRLPAQYFAAKDYHGHPTLNPDAPAVEELVTHKKIPVLKPLRFKPKA